MRCQSLPVTTSTSTWRTRDFPRLGAAAIDHLHADGHAVAGEDGGDVLAHPHGAAVAFDALFESSGDAAAAPFGKPRAVELVAGDLRVNGKGTLRRGQAKVAPLAGQQCT